MRTLPLTAALLLSTAAASAATPVKPCDLLSQSAAATLWGGPVQTPMDRAGAGCMYSRDHDEWILTQVFDAHAGAPTPHDLQDAPRWHPRRPHRRTHPRPRRDGTFTTATPEPNGKVVDYMVSVYGSGKAFKSPSAAPPIPTSSKT